jgi:hypothetical protein
VKILRVFPRRTNATPVDDYVHISSPDLFSGELEIDAVHISVTFSWDLPEADRLYNEWISIAPTKIGGPATGERGEEFVPGMYLKKGYVITSRGCPNRCWFCSVWRREGEALRELPITSGWNILDDNLLACSNEHIRGVFDMLSKQKHRPFFTGGLEAAKLKQWHVDELLRLKPAEMFFAYDTQDDREPLYEAGKILLASGLKPFHPLRAYVLIGYPKDSFEAAEYRLNDCIKAGFMPMAMLYRDDTGARSMEWARFQTMWARPAIIWSHYKKFYGVEA